jgi:hypothetical protein
VEAPVASSGGNKNLFWTKQILSLVLSLSLSLSISIYLS